MNVIMEQPLHYVLMEQTLYLCTCTVKLIPTIHVDSMEDFWTEILTSYATKIMCDEL